MQPSTFKTVAPPAQGAATPATVATAPHHCPAIVRIRNVGATLIILARNSGELSATGAAGGGTFELPIGTVETFLIEPDGAIFATGAGAGGRISSVLMEIPQETATAPGKRLPEQVASAVFDFYRPG